MKKNKIILLLSLPLGMALLTGCGENKDQDHTHTFSENWSYNNEMHWHEATCYHKELTSSLSAHTYNAEGVCTACGHHRDVPATETLKISVENGKANASDAFEQTYGLNEYATVKLTANEDCSLPEQIRVYSGNELILPETYTYVLSENKTSADFIIKMIKSFEVMVEGVQELGSLFIGETELTKSGDYSTLVSDQATEGKIVFNKETNTLALDGTNLKASRVGTTSYFDKRLSLEIGYLFAYTGTKPLTIELSGTNNFYLTDVESCDFKKGLFVSVNGGELNFTGASTNNIYGAGHSVIYSNASVNLTDLTLWSTYSGDYGIFAKELELDGANIDLNSIASEDSKYEKASMYGIYSYSTTINRSNVELLDFGTGIYATHLRIYSSPINIKANGKGIDCDWFTAYGALLGPDTYSTTITIKAKTGGISSYDTQEWNYAKADVETEKGHGIYTVDTTIYVYNSDLKGITHGEGDGIHAYRLYCVNSKIYGESEGNYNAGIRSSIYSGQSHKEDHQPFIYLENSVATGKGKYGAIFGIGSIQMNGVQLEEGWSDGTVKYLRHKHATNTYIYGIFDLSVEECVELVVSSGGTRVFIPENPIKECVLDATRK